jgi:uncharacterized protein (DUF4213/DUF364 family)
MLAKEIIDHILKSSDDCTTEDVRIGLGYTAVRLSNGRCGLAYTLHETEYESCCVIPEAGHLIGRKASDLIPWIDQRDVTACAVGLATANALLPPPVDAAEGDILDMLPVQADDSVGMVGFFGPLVGPLKDRVRELHVFERKANPGYGILPETAAQDLMPLCQVAVLSATTILNHTIDKLLEMCKKAREIAVLGPSAPFLPEILRRHGVTLVSGVEVADPEAILKIVSEGGGTRQFGKAVRKLTLRL